MFYGFMVQVVMAILPYRTVAKIFVLFLEKIAASTKNNLDDSIVEIIKKELN
jgi:hypothetical protein